jgi:hypothetical protein
MLAPTAAVVLDATAIGLTLKINPQIDLSIDDKGPGLGVYSALGTEISNWCWPQLGRW